ncbi:DUF6929 family protein [Terrimonas pollutisoli]|uniref:DUF6929 family protein n=1 Tax=Terrimonas pollutisoli TaxID=3034147 RepID=UPI0023EC5CDC|nr:hypothetical protein [Terrimonas sp. H1YJ31]
MLCNCRLYFRWTYLVVLLIFAACGGKQSNPTLVSMKVLDNYPSGSGLQHFNNKIYLVGDDASHLLAINKEFDILDSIKLFETPGSRIPKETKPDIESIALVKQNDSPLLLLTGSGSLAPYRNACWLVNPVTKETRQCQLDTFFQRLKNAGIADLNIEGATTTPVGIVLASRGNKSFRKNFLIVTSPRFWEKQSVADIKIIKAGANTDTSFFYGLSGIDYSAKTDQLLLTVSSENTYNSYVDGVIGKSYLWVINDISSKKKLAAVNPDRIIDLESIDNRFKSQKIESVCIVAEEKKQKQLVLAADDDKGHTVLFSMTLE